MKTLPGRSGLSDFNLRHRSRRNLDNNWDSSPTLPIRLVTTELLWVHNQGLNGKRLNPSGRLRATVIRSEYD